MTKTIKEDNKDTTKVSNKDIEDLKKWALELPTKYGINLLSWINKVQGEEVTEPEK